MNKLAELLIRHYKNEPNNIVLRSRNYKDGINFAKLYELSGKVYAYLKDHNIGKEDFVLILLPRDICVHICMTGIIRTGAAFTVLEDSYPKERIDFIINDIRPKLVITDEIFNEMMVCKSSEGYEDVNPHDACYAVYTSGSTGTPKGVVHEYGQIEHYLECRYDLEKFADNFFSFTCGVICPLNFIAHYFIFFSTIYTGVSLFIISYDVVKNFAHFGEFLAKENINMIFMTPSLLKAFKNIPPCLKVVLIGGENSSSIYVDGLNVVNIYSSSESGIFITCFEIDKIREKIPVGKNVGEMPIYLLDDDNKPCDYGEICFENIYFRGYINDPQKTKSVLVNGLFHTGDIGYFDSEGNLYVSGRKDDMIKINGNRIEPIEIETSLKQILNVNFVVAKGFNETNRAFVVAYFLKEELEKLSLLKDGKILIDFDDLQKKLLNKIPYYMVPTYYIPLDEIPMNKNGKIDKKALKSPTISEYYIDSEEANNDTEKYLCDLFKKVLNVNKVGIDDDFYSIGGDSITSIEFMANCKLKFLTINDLFKYRTPRKISKYYLSHFVNDDDIDKRNMKALSRPQDLLFEMIDFMDSNFYAPKSTMMNLPLLLKINKDVDLNRFREVVDKVLKHHPVFSTLLFFNEDTEVKQKYVPEIYEETKIIEVSENEFNELKNNLVVRYKSLFNSLLYRKAIYKVNDDIYLFLDIHHLITDGTSINLLISQINTIYFNPDYILPTDYYYLTLLENKIEQVKFQDKNNEIRKFYDDLAKDFINDKKFIPAYYQDSHNHNFAKIDLLKSLNIDKNTIHKYIKDSRLTENTFFMCACLICNSIRNKYHKVMINLIHNGRQNALLASSCGLLFRTHTVFADFSKYKTIKDFYEDVSSQVEFGIRSGDFNCSNYINSDLSLGIYFLYQKNIYNLDRFDIVNELIKVPNETAASDSLLEVNLVDSVNSDQFILKLSYAKGFYKENTIKNLLNRYEKVVNLLVESNLDESIKDILKYGK